MEYSDVDNLKTDVITDSETDAEVKIKKRKERLPSTKKRGKPFEKGHKFGFRFGEGQPINMSGRPEGGMSTIKRALKLYEDNALVAAEHLIENALSKGADPKAQFPWFKELNSRILGAAKGSAEDIIAQLSEKIDSTLSLSRSALEATAIGDAEGLIRELLKQGVLDKVIDKVKSESPQ